MADLAPLAFAVVLARALVAGFANHAAQTFLASYTLSEIQLACESMQGCFWGREICDAWWKTGLCHFERLPGRDTSRRGSSDDSVHRYACIYLLSRDESAVLCSFLRRRARLRRMK